MQKWQLLRVAREATRSLHAKGIYYRAGVNLTLDNLDELNKTIEKAFAPADICSISLVLSFKDKGPPVIVFFVYAKDAFVAWTEYSKAARNAFPSANPHHAVVMARCNKIKQEVEKHYSITLQDIE